MRQYFALFYASMASICSAVLATMMYNIIIPRDPSDGMMWVMFALFVFVTIVMINIAIDIIKELLK